MNLADIKEQVAERFAPLWEKIQESDIYQRLMEKYESLNPRAQKLVVFGGSTSLFLLFLYLFPMSFLGSASESIGAFEKNQKLIHDLFSVSRKLKNSPQFPPAPPVDMLKSSVENELINAGLLAEQKVSVEPATFNMGSLGPKDLITQGLVVYLKQLNLTQIVSVGYSLQSLANMPVKLLGMDITASDKDSHYFDVKYSLATFSLPAAKSFEEPEKPTKSKSPRRKSGK